MAGRIVRGEIRLYRFALPGKERPVVVLTRESAISYLAATTVAPVTSSIRGVPSEVALSSEEGMKAACAINLHHTMTVAKGRLGKRIGQLSPSRMGEVCAALRIALGCDAQ